MFNGRRIPFIQIRRLTLRWESGIRVLHMGSNIISLNFSTDWIFGESLCLYPQREMQAVMRFDTVTLRCQTVAVAGTGFAETCYWIIHDSRDRDRTTADSFPENYRRKLKKERDRENRLRNVIKLHIKNSLWILFWIVPFKNPTTFYNTYDVII